VQGHKIELTLQDIYFLIKLPPLGVVGDIHLMLPLGRNITEFVECHCPRDLRVKGMTIPIGDLEQLETRVVAIDRLRDLGS